MNLFKRKRRCDYCGKKYPIETLEFISVFGFCGWFKCEKCGAEANITDGSVW